MEIQLSYRLTYILDLLKELIARDIKVTYKHSILGFAWSLLNPLLHLFVFYFIFRLVMSIDIPRYSSYVFSGLLVYTWFQMSRWAGRATRNGKPIFTTNANCLLVGLPVN